MPTRTDNETALLSSVARSTRDHLEARIAELEAALRVFSAFGAALNKLSGPSPKSGDWYTIQAGDEPVTLRFEDFATATRAMKT